MAKDNVTPIGPHALLPVPQESASAELTRLSGYDGSIQGTPLEKALDERRIEIWEAQSIIESVAHAIEREFGQDWPAGRPNFPLALRAAGRILEKASGDLEAGTLEDRGLEIARAAEVTHE
jgi:hypothetical protein